MVTKTFGYNGVALAAVEDGESVPWGIRIAYAWKVLLGRVRIVGPVDISRLESDHVMEGRIQVGLTKGEVRRYTRA